MATSTPNVPPPPQCGAALRRTALPELGPRYLAVYPSPSSPPLIDWSFPQHHPDADEHATHKGEDGQEGARIGAQIKPVRAHAKRPAATRLIRALMPSAAAAKQMHATTSKIVSITRGPPLASPAPIRSACAVARYAES